MKTLTMTVIVMLLTACSFFEDEKKLQLKVLETSCTEVWLKIIPNGTETVQRNEEAIAIVSRATVNQK